MKFKVGDKVIVYNTSRFYLDDIVRKKAYAPNELGTVTEISDRSDTCSKKVRYLVIFSSSNKLMGFSDECLRSATIHDSKLARRLYRNQIEKIEDGKIWLK